MVNDKLKLCHTVILDSPQTPQTSLTKSIIMIG